MRSILRSISILSSIVILLLFVVFILRLNPVQPESSVIVLTAVEPMDIRSVTVSNISGGFHFYFDAVENGYVLDDIPPYLADLDVFVNFMNVCAGLTALMSIPAGDIDITESGLDAPASEVLIEFSDGSAVNLTVGAPEPVSGNYYALVGGFDDVYLIPRSAAQQFLLPKVQFVTKFVTPPTGLTSPLSAIGNVTFTADRFEAPLTIYQTSRADEDVRLAAISFGAPTHIVRSAVDYQLDQTYGAEIFGSLLGLRGEIVEYNLSDEDKADYGFADPYMTVSFDMLIEADAAPLHLVLQIADAEGDGRFYASLDGSSAVFLIGFEPFVDIDYAKLPVRWFLTPLMMDLSSVTIEAPDDTYHFDIDNTDSRNPVITHNGQTLNVDLFRSFYRLITSAAHDGAYSGLLPPPADAALLTITYNYINEDKQPDTLALHLSGVPGRVDVYKNGYGEFAMRDVFVRRVLDGAENLVLGNAIEENW